MFITITFHILLGQNLSFKAKFASKPSHSKETIFKRVAIHFYLLPQIESLIVSLILIAYRILSNVTPYF